MERPLKEADLSSADPALSSTTRAKSHVRGKKPKTAAPAVDAFACNELRLLIAMLAYQVMHRGPTRHGAARATGVPWSLRRLRERVLRGGTRLVTSARRATLTLARAVAQIWATVWPQIQTLRGVTHETPIHVYTDYPLTASPGAHSECARGPS